MKKIKCFLLGFGLGAIVFTGPKVSAFDGLHNIKVAFSNRPIYIEGSKANLSNKPILYEGTTYLPMRDVAQALGKEVLYDTSSRTIYIYSKGNEPTINEGKDNKQQDKDLAKQQEVSREFTINNISIGDSLEHLKSKLGEPARKDASEYGFTWYIYNKDYINYMQVGVEDNKVVAIYTNSINWRSKKGIGFGSTAESTKKTYGIPLSYIQKGLTRFYFNYDKESASTFLIDNCFATFFYDIHNNNAVTSIYIIDKDTELAFKSYYGKSSQELMDAYSRQIFDLANAVRARYDLKPFIWDDKAAKSSYLHCKDMADNSFFDHNNLKGESPFDRMQKQGIRYYAAGENIAAGSKNGIFAHEAWMNSEGHRKNILYDFDRLGVAVHFGGDYQIYYAQNFYTPR